MSTNTHDNAAVRPDDHAAPLPHETMPSWLPRVVADMVPNYALQTPEEQAVMRRLVDDPRMRRVWACMTKLAPVSSGMSCDDAVRLVFVLAFDTARGGLPVTLMRERRKRIEETEGGREGTGWSRDFMSLASLDDSPMEVSHRPDDPVAKRMQLTLSTWFQRTYGGPHLGLVKTITDVALDRTVSRMAGRLPRKPSNQKLIPAAGC